MKNNFDKSPLNYIGNKYKILPQIFNYFPKKINIMVDLFAGGCDVSTNVCAKEIIANDINNYIIEIYKTFQSMSIQEILNYIDKTIIINNLSKTNKEAYLKFRNKYNQTLTKNYLDLYILSCYSFNHQFRFNNKHEFNSPFGFNKSSFNHSIRQNLITFHKNIKNIHFQSNDFRDIDLSTLKKGDFLYADPPYLITIGSYNDGKRGFKGWTENDDKDLFNLLDELNDRNVKFALSNVLVHKGKKNTQLIDWKNKYQIHPINVNYRNCNYHTKNTEKETLEILITNY